MDYLAKVSEVLDKATKTQGPAIEKAAGYVSDAIAGGGVLHVFGCGHSQMYAMEVFYRAGGLAAVNAILTPALSITPRAPLSTAGERLPGYGNIILQNEPVAPGDALLIASTSARNSVPIDMAIEAKKLGLNVILLYSSEFANSVSSRHASGKMVMDFADVIIDNCGVSGDAIMECEGADAKFGPTSSVVGFALMQAMMVQAVENLIKQGIKPPIFISGNLDGGMDANLEIMKKYSSRVSSGAIFPIV